MTRMIFFLSVRCLRSISGDENRHKLPVWLTVIVITGDIADSVITARTEHSSVAAVHQNPEYKIFGITRSGNSIKCSLKTRSVSDEFSVSIIVRLWKLYRIKWSIRVSRRFSPSWAPANHSSAIISTNQFFGDAVFNRVRRSLSSSTSITCNIFPNTGAKASRLPSASSRRMMCTLPCFFAYDKAVLLFLSVKFTSAPGKTKIVVCRGHFWCQRVKIDTSKEKNSPDQIK